MIFHACCFVTIIEKLSENDLGQQIPDRCIRRNFEIDGHDMIDPNVTSNMSLRECQTLCKLTIGCHFFTYKIGFINQCLLKLQNLLVRAILGSTKAHPDILLVWHSTKNIGIFATKTIWGKE